MLYIGDIHGKEHDYKLLIRNHRESIALGDVGIGFPGYKQWNVKKGHKFLRGNHDNPFECKKLANYLGDYGLYKDSIFYISGGDSIDKAMRIVGVSWWEDEMLSQADLNAMVSLYGACRDKVRVVVSHECPFEAQKALFKYLPAYPNRMKLAMDEVLRIHRPQYWIFGHYHQFVRQEINGTTFICLNELGTIEI
jgi:predicted phosphohydrolase